MEIPTHLPDTEVGIVAFILAAISSVGGKEEVGVGILGFLTDFLWTFSVDKVFMTLGNFSLMILLLVLFIIHYVISGIYACWSFFNTIVASPDGS